MEWPKRTLGMTAEALRQIGAMGQPVLHLDALPLDDPARLRQGVQGVVQRGEGTVTLLVGE